jgi:Cu(I)/Ag(I) efflux system periplasmic protein CusF
MKGSNAMKRTLVCSVAIAVLVPLAAHAQGMGGMEMKGDMKGMDHKGMEKEAKKSQGQSHHAVGVVKSVDTAKGTLTVQHEPVPSMQWPAMSMTFKAQEKRMLGQLKPGAKVEFDFIQRGKDYVITKIK